MAGSGIGAAVGFVLGGFLGGWIGWRWTLVCAGAPGLIVGALVLATLKDRHRIQPARERPALQPVLRVLAMLLRRRSFVMVSLAFACIGFVDYTTSAFAGSFYLRVHAAGLARLAADWGVKPLAVIGLGLGLFGSLGGVLGSVVGGVLGDRMAARDVRALTAIPAVGMAISTIGYVVMFTVPSVLTSLLASGVASFFINFFGGPGSLALQQVAGRYSRATALAVTTFIASGIGAGIGPLSAGFISDALASRLGQGEGLRVAILVCLISGLIGAAFFASAGRTLERDIADANGTA
jgi:MFS family permease